MVQFEEQISWSLEWDIMTYFFLLFFRSLGSKSNKSYLSLPPCFDNWSIKLKVTILSLGPLWDPGREILTILSLRSWPEWAHSWAHFPNFSYIHSLLSTLFLLNYLQVLLHSAELSEIYKSTYLWKSKEMIQQCHSWFHYRVSRSNEWRLLFKWRKNMHWMDGKTIPNIYKLNCALPPKKLYKS